MVEEKYKLCDESLAQLLQWISEVEDTLAHQDVVQEDLENLRHQITGVKQVKEDLEAHSRQISACLDQVRQVIVTGSDVLSSDQVTTLEKNGRSLRTRFDRAYDRADKLFRRLTSARDELAKFKYVEHCRILYCVTLYVDINDQHYTLKTKISHRMSSNHCLSLKNPSNKHFQLTY